MIEIINKPLLLQLVGYLCSWQMGFNSVFKGLNFVPSSNFRCTTEFWRGPAVVQLLQTERSRVPLPMMSLGPGVDSGSNRNGHNEYFLGVKAAGA